MACGYCYIDDDPGPLMSRDTLRAVIERTFDYVSDLSSSAIVDFTWHGGEPLLAGVAFYRDAKRIQCERNRGLRFVNSIQTNGTLLTEEWMDFVQQEDFRVSVSIDGPAALHDEARKAPDGAGSYALVHESVERLRRRGIFFGVCVVLARHTLPFVEDLYDFLAEEQLPFNIVPFIRSGQGCSNYDLYGLTDREYADGWIRMYDRWFYADDRHYVHASDFVRKTRAVLTGWQSSCVGSPNCAQRTISVNPAGDVFPCASLTGMPDWKYGNLNERTLHELFQSEPAQKARARREDEHCANCRWRTICYGGCMARAIKFYGNCDRRDYYCPSLARIYSHVERRIQEEPRLRQYQPGQQVGPAVANAAGTDGYSATKRRNSHANR
jgi:uncharacterized protein